MAKFVSNMPLPAAISCSIIKDTTFDLVCQKISLVCQKVSFFFYWKAQSFNLIKHQKLMSVTFSPFLNKVPNNFGTNKGLIFDYAHLFILIAKNATINEFQ